MIRTKLKVKNTAQTASLFLMSLVMMTGCVMKHSQPNFAFAPEMHNAPSFKAQEEGVMRPLVQGTVPRGFRPYHVASMDEAKNLQNPLSKTKDVLLEGKNLYNTYCIVCHGQYGEGDGTVAALKDWPRPLYPRPPTLQSEKIRDYKDGQIFHVITMGQNLMPSYAEKLDERERWAVVHYLRALYRAKHPTAADLKAAETYFEEE